MISCTGWRRRALRRVEIHEGGRTETKRFKNPILAKPVEGHSTENFHEFSQDNKAQVAVNSLRARLMNGLFTMDLFKHVILRRPARDKIDFARLLTFDDFLEVRLECAGSPEEWFSKCRTVVETLAEYAECRNETSDAIVEANFLLFHQDHHSHCSCERFRQGCQIEDGIRVEGRLFRKQRTRAERAMIYDFFVPARKQHSPGRFPGPPPRRRRYRLLENP